ncbi:LOW QUALITY PROTEIN: hypothetical protein PanWU01x14_353260 [Parasponia andersonii]|uniref:Uncharacterized protein n=1 Tax=Parasponia andersonii TaxID=3476 RepID=A0A2P5AA10_PARAD|nr:LOW QUALITY PROTEIN: hypothetical protein PanWU01x14_353260 [Parasponia andersonii]
MNINSRFAVLLSLIFAATTICTAQQTGTLMALTGTLTFDGNTLTVGTLTVDGGLLTVDDGTSITINGGTLLREIGFAEALKYELRKLG